MNHVTHGPFGCLNHVAPVAMAALHMDGGFGLGADAIDDGM